MCTSISQRIFFFHHPLNDDRKSYKSIKNIRVTVLTQLQGKGTFNATDRVMTVIIAVTFVVRVVIMRKDTDIEALKGQSGREFEYRQFERGPRTSSNKSRWKLLEGVTNWSPGSRSAPRHRASTPDNSSHDSDGWQSSRQPAEVTPHQADIPSSSAEAPLPKHDLFMASPPLPDSPLGEASVHQLNERHQEVSAPEGINDGHHLPSSSSSSKAASAQSFGGLFKGYADDGQNTKSTRNTSLKALLRQIDS